MPVIIRILSITVLIALSIMSVQCIASVESDTGELTVTENNVGINNPIEEVSAEDMLDAVGVEPEIPDGADEVSYHIIEGDTGLIAQVDFVLDALKCQFRIMPSASFQDISGMYYEWSNCEDVEIGWCTGKAYWNDGEQGYIAWYDEVPGLLYCVSVFSDASGEVLTELAQKLYSPVQSDVDGDKISVTIISNYENGGEHAAFTAMDQDGNIVWMYESSTSFATELALINGFSTGNEYIVVNAETGVTALDIYTGEELWMLSRDECPVGGSIAWTIGDDGTIYMGGYYDSTIVAVSSEGKLKWISESVGDNMYWLYRLEPAESEILACFEFYNASDGAEQREGYAMFSMTDGTISSIGAY